MADPSSDLAAFGRFVEPALLILVSLATGPKHGYAIMDDSETWLGTRMGPGTLYGAISRLEALGLIEALAPVERRRPYQLTALGVRVLHQQLAQLRTLVAAGTRSLPA